MRVLVILLALGSLSTHPGLPEPGTCDDPCPNPVLYKDFCDKHGRNCAPIYFC